MTSDDLLQLARTPKRDEIVCRDRDLVVRSWGELWWEGPCVSCVCISGHKRSVMRSLVTLLKKCFFSSNLSFVVQVLLGEVPNQAALPQPGPPARHLLPAMPR